jgi:hypothetical protein
MRWLPSRSAYPREAHVPFYNRVFKRDSPVWASGPGTLWNCKCSVEPTDDPAEDGGTPAAVKPAPGIDNNPGESGEIFTKNHPYYKGLSKREIAAAEGLQHDAELIILRAVKKEIVNEMKPLYCKTVELTLGTETITTKFIRYGNKHIADDVVISRAKNMLTLDELRNIDERLKKATFVESAIVTEERKDGITKFYYFKDETKELYYNIAEWITKGKVQRFLYSLTKEIK